ncbi:hypothetical protein ACOMCU_01465 [Lysinibacillus sp. UGB7]|uniref:hypothetical protein n=1 Tax=Lysinibacillus sp. UGB7 TaxID=3411039 RepID=UPI003B818659
MKQINKEELKKVSKSQPFMCVKGKLTKNRSFKEVNEFKLKKGALFNLQYILGELTIYENASSLIAYQTTSSNEINELLKNYFHLTEGSQEKVYCAVTAEMSNINVFKEAMREVCVSEVRFLSVDKVAIIKADIFDIHEIVMFSKEYERKQIVVTNQNTTFTKHTIVESTGFVDINIDIAEYPIYHHL